MKSSATERADTGCAAEIAVTGSAPDNSRCSPDGVTRDVSNVSGNIPPVHRTFAHSSLQNVVLSLALEGTHVGARLAVMRIVLKPRPSVAYFFADSYIALYGTCTLVSIPHKHGFLRASEQAERGGNRGRGVMTPERNPGRPRYSCSTETRAP